MIHIYTVSAVYTGELGTGHFLRYKRKSALTGDFYFKIRFWGFKNLRYKRKSGLFDYGLSGGHCTVLCMNSLITKAYCKDTELIFRGEG